MSISDLTFAPVSTVIALLITAALAYFLGRWLKRKRSAVLIAGFVVPAFIIATGSHVTMGSAVVPPGILLMSILLAIAIVTPFTLVVSALTVRLTRQ